MQAIGYVRRSTDKQDMSLEQQRAKLQQFAESRGWKLVQVFSDDAISGSDMKRPGLESLLRFARESKDVQVVLTWERNRLARPKDPIDGLMLERELMSAGKQVFYAATGAQADRSFASGLIGYVEHHQNGDYLRKLSRDTMRGLVHRAEQGMWPGGPIPFGFDRLVIGEDGKPKRIVRDMSDTSQLVLDAGSGQQVERVSGGHRYAKQDFERCTLIPSESPRVEAVAKMFKDYAAGVPVRVIRDNLNRAGLRTARGRSFASATILPMLGNSAYLGHCVYNRRTESKWHRHSNGQSVERQDEGLEQRPESDWITKENAWPKIIDAETFAQVQARLKESKEKHRKVTGNAIHSPYLLGGIMFCGCCGGRLIGQTTTSGKGYRTRYYICSTYHKGDHSICKTRYQINAEKIEGYILDLIKTDLLKLRDDGTLQKYIEEELDRVGGERRNAREQLQRRLSDLDQQAARLRDHLREMKFETAKSLGLYDDAELLAAERLTVEDELGKLPADLPGLPPRPILMARAKQAFDQLDEVLAGGTIEEKRELIRLYVQTVKADPDSNSVQIGLYPALFTSVVAGACYVPQPATVQLTPHKIVQATIRAAFWQAWVRRAA